MSNTVDSRGWVWSEKKEKSPRTERLVLKVLHLPSGADAEFTCDQNGK